MPQHPSLGSKGSPKPGSTFTNINHHRCSFFQYTKMAEIILKTITIYLFLVYFPLTLPRHKQIGQLKGM